MRDVRIGGEGTWREDLRARGAKLYGFCPVAGSPRSGVIGGKVMASQVHAEP
jgi:hypothetical protein